MYWVKSDIGLTLTDEGEVRGFWSKYECSIMVSLNGVTKVKDYFYDKYNPTQEELFLFEMDLGFPYPDQELLDHMKEVCNAN